MRLDFPNLLTPFVGRSTELHDVVQRLADPTCRLLTLVGSGGVGKTRLALQVMSQTSPADGVFFVDLQPVTTADFLIPAIVDALKLPLVSSSSLVLQLQNYLATRHILLLLDNFEHLLPQVHLVTELLSAAPNLKLLVTSREALNLQEEWLYPITGLSFPQDDEGETTATYEAVQLFVERVQRIQPDFSLVQERKGVIRICQLVAGMPLALELAAPWTKTLPCMAIATEIQHSLDFLTTKLCNFPQRHSSIQAVFDQSWQMLTAAEQAVFQRLAVFRGGFQRQAAEVVAEATLSSLSALVDKSLVQREPDGRYHLHELLRQYAQERLETSADTAVYTYTQHSTYYADFLHQRQRAILGRNGHKVLQEITDELDNIRTAWQAAIHSNNSGNLRRVAFTYYIYCDMQGRYRESVDAFEQALQAFGDWHTESHPNMDLIIVRLYLGWAYIRLGRLDEVETILKQSHELFCRFNQPPPAIFASDPQLGLALLALIRGEYDRATELAGKLRHYFEDNREDYNLCVAYYILANAALGLGKYDTAWTYGRQAYHIAQKTEVIWFVGYTLSDLGTIARARGEYAQAQHYYQESYVIKETLNDPEGIASTLYGLGKTAWLQGDYRHAKQIFQRSLTLYQDMHDQGGLARVYNGLGNVACSLGDHASAQHYFHQALHIAVMIHFTPVILAILVSIGDWYNQRGQTNRAAILLTLAQTHPAISGENRTRAQQLLAKIKPTVVTKTADLEQVTTDLLLELTEEMFFPATSSLDPTSAPIEPLTERELEVLQLLAQGLTNPQIAKQLIIAIGTVKSYTGQIYRKLGVRNRTLAVLRARELHLIL